MSEIVEEMEEVEEVETVEEHEQEAWDSWIANGCEEDIDIFRDCYAGEYESVEDYVEEVTRECQEIPEWVDYYIDWKSMARDWQMSGDIWSDEVGYNRVHIFRSY
jgi:antirestriction protein